MDKELDTRSPPASTVTHQLQTQFACFFAHPLHDYCNDTIVLGQRIETTILHPDWSQIQFNLFEDTTLSPIRQT